MSGRDQMRRRGGQGCAGRAGAPPLTLPPKRIPMPRLVQRQNRRQRESRRSDRPAPGVTAPEWGGGGHRWRRRTCESKETGTAKGSAEAFPAASCTCGRGGSRQGSSIAHSWTNDGPIGADLRPRCSTGGWEKKMQVCWRLAGPRGRASGASSRDAGSTEQPESNRHA